MERLLLSGRKRSKRKVIKTHLKKYSESTWKCSNIRYLGSWYRYGFKGSESGVMRRGGRDRLFLDFNSRPCYN